MTSLSAEAASLQDLAAQLRSLREATLQLQRLEPTSGTNTRVDEVLRLLGQMESLPVTKDSLRESGAGREVNHKFLRAHPSAEVQERSKALVLSWKASVGLGEASTTTSTPACSRTQEQKESPEEQPETGKAPEDPETPSSINEKKRRASSPEASPDKKQKTTTSQTEDDSSAAPNQGIADLFKELSDFEFKRKEKFKAIAYKKVADTLRNHSKKVASGKEASSLPGIGKESAKKIDQFLSTGEIERLEKYRRGDFD